MAPIRRYLRITKYSVLEVRIYLDNPALAQSWLLNPRAPVLPKVIESIRPLVLPKLREERERAKKKSTKKRALKDVVVQDDFEVAIFLTETNTRHSILYKHKHMRDKTQKRLQSNSSKLTGGGSADAAIDLDDGDAARDQDSDVELVRVESGHKMPNLLREDSDDDAVVALHDIPVAPQPAAGAETRGTKRRRARSDAVDSAEKDPEDAEFQISDDSEEEGELDDVDEAEARPRRNKSKKVAQPPTESDEKKKKMVMDITYQGFAIYGRVLCLVVKKRAATSSVATVTGAVGRSKSGRAQAAAASSRGGGATAGQAKMENWIASTQVAPADGEGGEDG